jgi:hypothetical protein
MSTPFWTNDPTILLNKDNITELWPLKSMDYEQKLNAISRLVIILTIFGIAFTGSLRFLTIGIFTLGLIFVLWKQQVGVNSKKKEGFSNQPVTIASSDAAPNTTINPITLEAVLKSDYLMGTKRNPFSNVLLTEIMDDPERKSAPPSFNPDVLEDITQNTKKTVQLLNPGIKNTNKQLFGSLTDQFYLDQSNRSFVSNPSTKIPNDQGAFAQYLYGDMPSCRDGDGVACVQDNYRYTLY